MKSFSHLRESSILETKSAPKGFHFTKDGKLKRGDADVDGSGGPKLRSDPLDKQRNKVPPVSEASGESYLKHRVSVTVSDPQHTMASKRDEKMEKRVRFLAKSDSDAVTLAKNHFKKQGYKVHGANYLGITESKVIIAPKKMVGEPEKGTYAYERKYGKFTAKGELRKKPNPNKPPVKEAANTPGYMLKADPALAKKVKEKQDLHKIRAKAMGNPAAGKSIKESVKTTHEDPLVTVHDKNGLHTHANLSTANAIFATNVKHTDVHKGPVTVSTKGHGGRLSQTLKFAISKHHETEMKENIK